MSTIKGKGKGKFTLEQATKAQMGVDVQLYSFFNLSTRWGRCSRPRPSRFTPGKSLCTFYRRLGGSQGHSGRVQKNLVPTAIQSPDHPAHSKSQYWLSYSSPHQQINSTKSLKHSKVFIFRVKQTTIPLALPDYSSLINPNIKSLTYHFINP